MTICTSQPWCCWQTILKPNLWSYPWLLAVHQVHIHVCCHHLSTAFPSTRIAAVNKYLFRHSLWTFSHATFGLDPLDWNTRPIEAGQCQQLMRWYYRFQKLSLDLNLCMVLIMLHDMHSDKRSAFQLSCRTATLQNIGNQVQHIEQYRRGQNVQRIGDLETSGAWLVKNNSNKLYSVQVDTLQQIWHVQECRLVSQSNKAEGQACTILVVLGWT